ncbi:ATP-dependent DNA helicase [bacterium]|nr:ATP-dependent DNA helicase [bacterium]
MDRVLSPVLSFKEILGHDGPFARSLPNYEYRSSQVEMAEIIADAMKGQKTALIEAGTGTGKTIAYLLPLICLGLRCVVSTGTKNLQAQLIRKDIPLLEKTFGRSIKAYSLKGRSNYICWRKWRQFLARPGLNLSGIGDSLTVIKKWVSKTSKGEQSELEWLADDDPLWSEICSSTDTCRGQKCENYESCFVTKARQEAASADLVIVNHHLLMADCCLRQRANVSAIPNYSRLILDEAHMIEQIATEYFGLMVSARRIQDLTGDIRREMSEAHVEKKEIHECMDHVIKRSFAFFGSIPIAEERFAINEGVITAEARDNLYNLLRSLELLDSNLEEITPKCDSISGCRRRAQEIKSTLEFIADHGDPDYVFWGERQGNSLTLKVSPIDISQQLSIHLFKPLKGVVLTSATLSTGQDFDYVRSRLGVSPDIELMLESHFDYKKQAVIFIPMDMPGPASDEFLEHLGPRISQILRLTNGRTLLLFTSYRNLNATYKYLCRENLGYKLLKQGDRPKECLLEEFCSDISSVLFATSSFWQGVDVPGDALSCVIIDRLPFSVPTDPVTEARINWIRNRGGNPFLEYQLPSAVILLKQGLGRLIRHRNDRGLLVILDSRICTKSYGKIILKDLPKCPVVLTLDKTVTDFISH